jgi:PIN domain nuclease of toxin-antitoxin system
MRQALSFPGLHLAPITGEIACSCAELPPSFHGDPADRLIAATARCEGLTLLTHDRRLLELADTGHLTAIAV